MDLRLLNYFVAVYEERNATKAAARCYVSQPSLSNALRQLEDELGTKLFERGSKGMTSTDEADHLYPRARRLLDESRDLSAMFREERKGRTFVVGTFQDLSPSRMCAALEKLHLAYPDLNFRMVDHEAISDARITLDVLKREDELFLPLWEEDYALCVRKDHPFAGRKLITPEDLNGQRFIECPPCEAHQQTIGILAESVYRMDIFARADHKTQVMHLVQAGIGISFLPTGLLEISSELTTVPFDGPRMFRSVGLCYPAGRSRSPLMEKIVKVFEE